MTRSPLSLMIASCLLAAVSAADVQASGGGAGHRFKGVIEVEARSNDNIAIAPSSSERFDYATRGEFVEDGEDEGEDDFADDAWDDFDGFDDLVDADPAEDDIADDSGIDGDGDGLDDLIDPNANAPVDSESRFTTKLGISHQYRFPSRRATWNNSVRFSSDRHAQRDALDKFNWAVTTGFGFAPRGSRHIFRPSLSYVALEKDSRAFSSTLIASFAYTYRASKQLELGATYNYQDRDISNPAAPDARVDVLSLGAEWSPTPNDVFKLEVAPKVEDSSEITRNSDAWGVEATYSRRLPWDLVAGVGFRFDSIDYVNLTPGRKDDNTTWALQLQRDFGPRFGLALGVETRDRASNIPGKDARNDSVYLGGAYRF